MTRSVLLSTLGVALALTLGCNKAADEQRKADEARAEANEKIVQANDDATKKINYAASEADREVAEAQAKFLKMREEYRHEMTENMLDLDKRIADLEAKAIVDTGKSKTELNNRLAQIRVQREAFVADYRTIETTPANAWDASKERLDKEWKALKKSVDDAR